MNFSINGKKHTFALEIGPGDSPKIFYEMLRFLFAERRFNPNGPAERKWVRFWTECIAACQEGSQREQDGS
jgi:hypothetical protein